MFNFGVMQEVKGQGHTTPRSVELVFYSDLYIVVTSRICYTDITIGRTSPDDCAKLHDVASRRTEPVRCCFW